MPKAGPYLVSPRSSSFKRHVPGWARSSWATEGHNSGLFLCQRPRVAVRNGIPNRAQPRHGVVCPPRRDVHIIDNMPGCTDTVLTTSVHPPSSSPLEASWAAWASSGLAIARLSSSGPNLQTTRGIRVRCTCGYSFPTPHPYSRRTLSSPTTRVTRSRAGADTIHRLCRIPMLTGVHPLTPNTSTIVLPRRSVYVPGGGGRLWMLVRRPWGGCEDSDSSPRAGVV